MKVCLKGPLSKNPHHAEGSQLIFIECLITDQHMKQDLTDRSHQTDLKITRTVENF